MTWELAAVCSAFGLFFVVIWLDVIATVPLLE